MSLLKPAVIETAFLKMGMWGFAGAGKTFTASELAIGLCHLIGNKKAAFFDTESGSDYMIKKFKAANVDLFVHKGRAFQDLCTIVRECEKEGYGVLLIDSITHVWREIQTSYLRNARRENLIMQDWNVIKGQWQEFSDLFLNSKLHILMLGRAGYEYDQEKNEAGKKQLVKVGTKMKVESEMGFEPSLIVEMEAIENEKTGGLDHVGWVLKDRSQLMNGKKLINPKFEDFKPVIEYLNLGGEHSGVNTTRDSQQLFKDPDYSYEERQRKRAIAIEELHEVFVLNGLDGRSTEAIKRKTEILKEVFSSSSKTYIEEKVKLEELVAGIQRIKNMYPPPSTQEAKQ